MGDETPLESIVKRMYQLGRELDAIKTALYWIIALLSALLVSMWKD